MLTHIVIILPGVSKQLCQIARVLIGTVNGTVAIQVVGTCVAHVADPLSQHAQLSEAGIGWKMSQSGQSVTE